MNYLNARALVLRRNPFSESSVTLALFTREYGRLDALAKGARREKSPLFGHLDLYQVEDVTLVERPASGLDLLVESAFVDEHAGLRFCPGALAAAGTLCELALHGCMPRDPHPEVFHILAESLAFLGRLGEPSVHAGLGRSSMTREERAALAQRSLRVAMLGILKWLGFGLELSRCVACGAPAARAPKWRLSFRGGVVCESCRRGGARGAWLSAAAFAALVADAGGGRIGEMSLTAGERRDLLRFLVDYSQYVLEKPLGGSKVLFQLLR